MGDAIAMWRHTKMVVLVALTAALYAALLVPFKPIPIIPGITELRPANVVPVVCSLLFGPAAAWGSAIGNLVGDFFGTLGPGSIFGFIGNFLLGYLPYRFWRLLAGRREPVISLGDLPAFFDVCLLSSAACALVIAWGVDVLGLVPFKILATVITLNNFLAAFVLGLALLPFLLPRAVRWRLVYWEIMSEEELADGSQAWLGVVLLTATTLFGVAWAALLFLGPHQLPSWAAGDLVRPGALAIVVLLLVGSSLLAQAPRHELKSAARDARAALQTGPTDLALAVEDVSFTYPAASKPALAGVSFTQAAGELRFVMGATGAGKTTLTLALSGVIPALEPGEFSGRVHVYGRQVSHTPPRLLAGLVGLVQQDFETQLLGSKVEGAVAFALENLGFEPEEIRRRVGEALEAVGATALREREPLSLSGGEKQRVVLASLLALKPRLLVLDEPTTDLDPLGRDQVCRAWQKLGQAGHTLVVTEIDAEVAALGDRINVLRQGEVVFDGPPGELFGVPHRCTDFGLVATEAAQVAVALGLQGPWREDEVVAALAEAQAQLPEPVSLRPAAPPSRAPGEVLLAARELRAGYGGREILRGVDLQVREGEVVALLGRNGSGKTTLARCLDGLLRPIAGRVELAGGEPYDMLRPDIARLVGMVFQNPDHQLVAMTVREELALGPRLAGLGEKEAQQGVQWALGVAGLEDVADEDPFALPKGLRQKVALASVLAFRPPVIIFDEPTTGLDGLEQVEMLELLRRLADEGRAVLVITHAVWAAARYADRVVLLSEGRLLADGPTREVLARADLLAAAGVAPPPSVRISQQLFGQTLLSPEEFSRYVRLGPRPPGGGAA